MSTTHYINPFISDESKYFQINVGNYTTLGGFAKEKIWGHRLYKSQDISYVLLEFLNVFLYKGFIDYRNTDDFKNGILKYKKKLNLMLRRIVFNNPYLDHINSREDGSDKWELLKKSVKDLWGIEATKIDEYIDYVKEQFSDTNIDSFDAFVQTIHLIQNSAIGAHSDQIRWTSKLPFPFDANALCYETDLGFHTDRVYFARGGELTYLMLSRAKHVAELDKLVSDKLLKINKDTSILGGCIKKLVYEDDFDTEIFGGFLPNKTYKRFDIFCDDLINILKRDDIPSNDAIIYIKNLIGLHLSLYQLEKSVEILNKIHPNEKRDLQLLSFVPSEENKNFKKIAKRYFEINKTLFEEALVSYITYIVDDILNGDYGDFDNKKTLLKEEFSLKSLDVDNEDKCKKYILKLLASKSNQIDSFMIYNRYFSHIGFVSKMGHNGYIYTISDQFLKTLVIANVEKETNSIQFDAFLEKLYKKYYIVLTEDFIKDESVVKDRVSMFEKNKEALLDKLNNLGLVKKFSDAYSYVIYRG